MWGQKLRTTRPASRGPTAATRDSRAPTTTTLLYVVSSRVQVQRQRLPAPRLDPDRRLGGHLSIDRGRQGAACHPPGGDPRARGGGGCTPLDRGAPKKVDLPAEPIVRELSDRRQTAATCDLRPGPPSHSGRAFTASE